MRKQVHVYYSGRVQGVGFRLTAEETALRFSIIGWVKNLRDGRVELVAEGEEAILAQFLNDLRTGTMKNFIKQVELSWSAASETFNEFEIRYY